MNTFIEKTLKRIILVGIFAVPFLAFLVPASLFFPFITGKNFAFRIIVEFIFAAWVLLALYREAYRPKYSWIMTAAAAFTGIIFVADLLGANQLQSFWSNYERMEGFVGLIHVFAFFVVIGSFLTRNLWQKYIQTFLISSAFMSFYGFLQLTGKITINQGSSRLDATFGNSAYLGIYMLFNIFLAAYLLVREKKGSGMKWLYWPIIILDFVIMYYTATRGVLLGFLGGVIFSAILVALFEKKHPAVKKGVAGVLVAIVAVVGLFFIFKNSSLVKNSPVLSRMASISLSDGDTQARFMVWSMAIDGFKERPILGWGQDNFNLVFNKYYNAKMFDREQWFDRAHDIFLDWLIAGGIFGLLSYLFLFVSGVVLVWRPETDIPKGSLLFRFKHILTRYFSGEESDKVLENSILTGLFVAYFINNIFVFDNLYSYILFFSVLALLHSRHAVPFGRLVSTGAVLKSEKDNDLSFMYPGITAAVVLMFVLYVVNIKPIQANALLIEAVRPSSGGFSQENIDSFENALSYGTFGNGEIREQLIQTSMRAKGASNVSDDLKQKLFNLARREALLQISDDSEDARAEMFAGMLFYNYGMTSDAVAHFERAHELSPQKQAINANLILAYVNESKMAEAFELAKTSYESEPRNPDAARVYAIAALASGDQKLSDKIMTENFGSPLVYDDNFINIYALLGNYDRVIAILEKELAKNTDNPQLQIRLAAAYATAGDRGKGIEILRGIIAKHPDFAEQGQTYIDMIRQGKI